jgi:hypothetical protein
MSRRVQGRRIAVALGLLVSAACGEARPPARALPNGFRLVQKGAYQALYGPNGRLARVLRDDDRDGVADAIVLYGDDGRPAQIELDTNGDHVIDRREILPPDRTFDLDEPGDGEAARTDHAER